MQADEPKALVVVEGVLGNRSLGQVGQALLVAALPDGCFPELGSAIKGVLKTLKESVVLLGDSAPTVAAKGDGTKAISGGDGARRKGGEDRVASGG